MLDEPVAVHYLDGHVLTGYADEFAPGESELLIRDAGTDEHVTVFLRQVKVVCFVRSLASTGVVRNREQPPVLHQAHGGRRVELVFKDGEKMGGTVSLPDAPRAGFYLTPLNPSANSAKVYVNPEALVSFRFVT